MCECLPYVSRKMVVSLLERNSREKFEGGIDEESIFGCTKLATLGAIKW